MGRGRGRPGWRVHADRWPFLLNEQNCLGEIKGAKFIERNELEKQGWVAPHIWQLKEEQEKEEAATAK